MLIIRNCVVENPKVELSEPFEFSIEFELTDNLDGVLEWKVIYVGSAESEKYDQELDQFEVGPIPAGKNKFQIKTPKGPDTTKIPSEELIGNTVVMVQALYRNQLAVQIGYYVNNQADESGKIIRDTLAQKPRVTTFEIDWKSV